MSKSWSTPTRYLVLILVLVFIIWLLVSAQALIGPLAISALLAYVLNPIVTFVNTRTKLSRNYVVLLVYLLSLAALVGLGFILVPIIPGQITTAIREVERIIIDIERNLIAITPLDIFGVEISLEQIEASMPVISSDFLQADALLNVLRTASTNLVWVLVILVTTYYLLQDWGRLRTWIFNLAPPDYRMDMRRLYIELKNVWQRYLRGQLVLMFLVGVITGVSLAAIGLPGAIAFGLFAGLLDVILTIGPTLVMLVAAIVALFAGSTFLNISNLWFMVLVLGIFTAIQGIENVWLRPRVMGQSLRMHPGVVFIGVIGALSLAGILAALIIIPVMGSVGVIGRYIYAKILNIPPWVEEKNEKAKDGETAVPHPKSTHFSTKPTDT